MFSVQRVNRVAHYRFRSPLINVRAVEPVLRLVVGRRISRVVFRRDD